MIQKLFIVLCFVLSTKAIAADNGQDYMAFTDKVAKEIITLIKQENLTRKEKEERFGKILDKYFNLKAIGSYALGRYNKIATPNEKTQFHDLFRALMIKNYTSSFTSYKNEKVTAQSLKKSQDGNSYLVKSMVEKEETPNPIFVEWLIYPGPKIYDVVVEGVSQALAMRAEFASIIQGGGGTIDVLLRAMREQIAVD